MLSSVILLPERLEDFPISFKSFREKDPFVNKGLEVSGYS